jgi:hypothetical protein
VKTPNAARAVLTLIVATTVTISSQQSTSNSEQAPAIADRIAELTTHLQISSSNPDPSDEWYAQLDAWTNRLVSEVDNYIQANFNPSESAQGLQSKLRALLKSHVPNSEYGDLPLVQVADLPSGRVLLVAYTIVRGVHHSLPIVRGYQWVTNKFRLVGHAADDFYDYNMFKSVLPSPIKGEIWLLAWGQAHTFNGKKVRARIYAFDGRTFATVWNPEDVYNADVRVTGNGFVIDHELLDRRPPQEVHDEYVLTPAGPVKSN